MIRTLTDAVLEVVVTVTGFVVIFAAVAVVFRAVENAAIRRGYVRRHRDGHLVWTSAYVPPIDRYDRDGSR